MVYIISVSFSYFYCAVFSLLSFFGREKFFQAPRRQVIASWYLSASIYNSSFSSCSCLHTALNLVKSKYGVMVSWIRPANRSGSKASNSHDSPPYWLMYCLNLVSVVLAGFGGGETRNVKDWYEDDTFTTWFDPSREITANLTLYAKWHEGEHRNGDQIQVWAATGGKVAAQYTPSEPNVYEMDSNWYITDDTNFT